MSKTTKFETYPGVHGQRNVARITRAIEEAGGRILTAPSPSVAPYQYLIELPSGEHRDVICYAFTANRYRQANRPAGEHRFQIKYGSRFDRYHDIYFDPAGRRTTLMFGVDHELDLFVAVDPLMHSPTWFSVSVEFKDGDLLEARRCGWHGWQRERSPVRRKRVSPLESFQTEAVCAFTALHFLDYIEFERCASGLDASERLLVGKALARAGRANPGQLHPLELQLGVTREELLTVLTGNARLLTAVRGRVAEHHLGAFLKSISGISSVVPLDQDGPPDFSIVYRERPFRIECKNIGTNSRRPKVDFQKTRAAKRDPCSRYYSASQFEVLAACMHPVTERWEYKFCPTHSLQGHKTCPGKLSEHVYVEGAAWTSSLRDLLDLMF